MMSQVVFYFCTVLWIRTNNMVVITAHSVFKTALYIGLPLMMFGCSGGGGGGGDDDAPASVLRAPLGGNVLKGNILVQWETTDENPGSVEIAYSTDSGQTFSVIETAVLDGNSGVNEYVWDTVNNPPAPAEGSSFRIRVRATDIPGNVGNDAVSTNDFTIDNSPPGTIPTPLAQSLVNNVQTLEWITSDLEAGTVSLHLSSDGGASFPVLLADAIVDDGNFDWDTTAFSDGGIYKVSITPTDTAGNIGTTQVYANDFSIDNTPPAIADANLQISIITANSMTVSWNKATDIVTTQANLQYQLLFSESNNLDSIVNVLANGTSVDVFTDDIDTLPVAGLTSVTPYFWALLVRDELNNTAMYNTRAQGTVASGDPDTTFNGTGQQFHHNAAGGNAGDEGASVALDNNANIVVAGKSIGTSEDAVVWRYTITGVLDSGFNGTGFAVSNNAAGGNILDRANAVFVDADNRIVLTGTSSNLADRDMVVWRYLQTGVLDSAFDPAENDGIVVHTSASGHDEGFAVVVDDQNRIIVTGKLNNGSNDDMALWRFNENGSPDTSFGTNGLVTHTGIAGNTNSFDEGRAVVLKPTGDSLNPYHIFVTGSSSSNGNENNDNMVIWRFDANGDTVAGDTNGIFATSLDASSATFGLIHDTGNAILIDNQGNIVVAGTHDAANRKIVIWRFLANGNPDTAFNSSDMSGFVTDVILAGFINIRAHDVALDNANNLVIAGQARNVLGNDDMAVWRFKSNGDADTSLDGDGVVLGAGIEADKNEVGTGLTIDSNGKIVVTGYGVNVGGNRDTLVWQFR